MIGAYRYDDFSLGQVFRSGDYAVTEAEIIAFASQYDPQPQHLSAAAAAESGFGQLVASGWHTAAISMRLFITEALPPIAGGSQGAGVDRLLWPRPVRPGDRLHVRVEVVAMRPSRSRPERGLMTLRATTFNQDDDIVMSAEHTVMLPRQVAG